MNVEVQQPQAQALSPFAFFEGDVEFSGFVQDLTGKVRRHYKGSIDCKTSDDKLILDEHLLFNDGAQERRIWTIRQTGETLTGVADDLVGSAHITSINKDEMRWRYVMEIEIGGKRRPFDFEDVFVQTDDHTLISKTTMTKFGIPLARLFSTYHRV
ncbi:MAG: DUF3833 family protein [Pseudomonadota bacterium]